MNVQIRTRKADIQRLSCKLELINNPESIAQIYLGSVVQVGHAEFLVGQAGIVRVVQKPGNRK